MFCKLLEAHQLSDQVNTANWNLCAHAIEVKDTFTPGCFSEEDVRQPLRLL